MLINALTHWLIIHFKKIMKKEKTITVLINFFIFYKNGQNFPKMQY